MKSIIVSVVKSNNWQIDNRFSTAEKKYQFSVCFSFSLLINNDVLISYKNIAKHLFN